MEHHRRNHISHESSGMIDTKEWFHDQYVLRDIIIAVHSNNNILSSASRGKRRQIVQSVFGEVPRYKLLLFIEILNLGLKFHRD
jgi:hypothetical protein